MDPQRVETLLRELDAQREAYLESFMKVHELLAQNIAANAAASAPQSTLPVSPTTPSPGLPPKADVRNRNSISWSRPRADSDRDPSAPLIPPALRKTSTGFQTYNTSSDSRGAGEDSDEEDDESLYVSTPLEPESHDLEGLRHHLRSSRWDPDCRKVLEGIVDNPRRLSQHPLIPDTKKPLPDRSDLAHYQVYDVGPDGSPLPVDLTAVDRHMGRPMAIWRAISEINPPSKQRHAVGRITILREPSALLFGALHHTFSRHFDMDELFRDLVKCESSFASVNRAFEEDPRRQRSFVFNFEYFTLIEKGCQPMSWQIAAHQEDRKPGHIALTRCSSVVALVLNGPVVKRVKNPQRRAKREHGYVYDPFSSWQVLNIQCFPDLEATLDGHDATAHYVNGPDAFLNTLLGEYRDAQERFSRISRSIARLVRPPLEFMFDKKIRDGLLFEDDDYTMARRYFWALQTLGIMNESIKALIDAFENSFPDEVWEGKHKLLWPLLDEGSARNVYYKKKMAGLKKQFGTEMVGLKKLVRENELRRREIMGLKEDLFTGTSIQESRKSVMATETTVQQGHNIKLLTLVSIFFLPLTFVTGVFGMEDRDANGFFDVFAIVTVTVCVPFFLLVGSLNTHKGMAFWRARWHAAYNAAAAFLAWIIRFGRARREGVALGVGKSFEREDGGGGGARVSLDAAGRVGGAKLRRWPTGRVGEGGDPDVEMGTADERGKAGAGGEEEGEEAGGVGTVVFADEAIESPRRALVSRLPTAPESRIAEMWDGERRKRLSGDGEKGG